jgi:hypothetical protein
MKVAYVAGAYRAKTKIGILINIIKARRIAKKLWKMGYVVICPHSNSAFMANKQLPESVFLDGYLSLLSRVDVVVLRPGWKKSAGTMEEVQVAFNLGKQIIDWQECRQMERLERSH